MAASAAWFLGPLVLAVAGATWWDQSGPSQLAGALGGLALGMAVSIAAVRLLVRSGKENG